MARTEQAGWPESMIELAEPQEGPTFDEGPVVLRRDTGKNPGGGVCAGIARYVQIDVIFVRLAFVLLTIGSGIGIPIYIAAYALMPRAEEDDRVSFAPGSLQLRNARLAALLGIIALGIVAAIVTIVPGLDWWNVAPIVLVTFAVIVLVL